MDFKITEEVSGEVICATLNSVFPDGLRALEAYEPTSKFHDIGWADYEIRMEVAQAETHVESVKNALAEPIVIEKTTKIGTRTLDVSDFVKILSVSEEEGLLVLCVKLCCDDMNFVNPKYVIDFISRKVGIPGELDDYSVCRTAVYREDGTTPFR